MVVFKVGNRDSECIIFDFFIFVVILFVIFIGKFTRNIFMYLFITIKI